MVEDTTGGPPREGVNLDDGPMIAIHLIAQRPESAPGKVKFEMALAKSDDYIPDVKLAELIACCATALHIGLRMMEKGPWPIPPGLPVSDLANHAAELADKAVHHNGEAVKLAEAVRRAAK